jgi:hypothetical protein
MAACPVDRCGMMSEPGQPRAGAHAMDKKAKNPKKLKTAKPKGASKPA